MPCDAEPTPDPDAERARTERHVTMLAELAEIGMDLARLVHGQSLEMARQGDPLPADVGLKYARIARAVRQTLALEAQMAAEGAIRDREARRIADQRRQAAEAEAFRKRTAPRRAASDAVEALIDNLDLPHAERLLDDLDDWVDEALDTAAARPIPDLIAEICAALGVTPDWSLWADEKWMRPKLGESNSPSLPFMGRVASAQGVEPGGASDAQSPPVSPSAIHPPHRGEGGKGDPAPP